MSREENRLNVSELDFREIRENLKTFLRSQDTLQDYDFEGSAISTIVDLLSYVTHYNAVNANLGINETFLDTAQFRGSVVGHARQLGFTPRSAAAAIAFLDITVNDPSDTDLTLPRGHRFKAKIGNETFNFVTDRDYNTETASFSNVKIFQGNFKTIEFDFDTESSEKLVIPDADVDTSALRVEVFDSRTSSTSTVFNEIKELVDVKADSNVYFLAENPDGLFEISFGDGVIGTALQDGNLVRVEYLVTKKAAANGASVFSSIDAIEGNTDLSITVNQNASGGDEKESTESIRRNAPLSYASQNRVVVPQDYDAVVRENFPNLDSIKVWGGEDNDPPKYGKAFVSIKPKDALILTDEEKETVINDIIRPKSMLTVDTELVDPEFLFITLEVFFKFDPSLTNLTKTQLENKVVTAIETFDEEQLRKFDRVLRYSQLLSVIDNADPAVLNSFARVLVQKRFVPRLNVAQTYELEFSVDLFKSFGTRPVIFLSTEFTVDGLDDCRFTDVLNNDNTRRIQIVRGSAESPQVVVDNAGTIEGSKITLVNFQPERFEGSTIVIECIPNSYNVFGKRNTILTIDCGCPQFKVEGSVDTFATGAEYAGDTYEVAPKNADL
jgi:flagellin-like hook-associated protein FlgL